MNITGGLAAEAYDREYSDAQLVRRSAEYFRPHTRSVATVVLVVTLASLAAAGVPIIISRGLDLLELDRQVSLALALGALVTVLGALNWVLTFVRQRLSARAVGDVVLQLRSDAFRAVMQHDLSFFDRYAAGRIVSRVTSDTQDFATVVTLVIDLLSQLMLIVVISCVMLAVNWRLALITLSVGPLVVLVALVFRRIARRVMQQAQRGVASLNATIHETIGGIAVAKSFRQEAAIYADFRDSNDMAYRVQLARANVFGSIHPILHAIRGIATGVVIFAGGMLVLNNAVSVGDWYLYVQCLALFFYPVVMVASFWGQFQQGLAASERVFALIDAEPQVVQQAQEDPGRLVGKISFSDVWFAYGEAANQQTNEPSNQHPENRPAPSGADEPDTLKPETRNLKPVWVLPGFSLEIPAGETLAVVGHTGAGKSSLVKLIMRFYEFNAGQLLIDDRDIRRLDLAAYRRQIGLVPQAPFLFGGSIADNIRYGRPDADDRAVEAAARSLGDGSWIDALPAGLATDVGERGAQLSFGQRQLVALARVLLQDPAILLLDEATASIDPFTEREVQAGLAAAMAGRTSIVIAHRLSTIQTADRIIVLDRGTVIEQGDHEALLERGGHYAELFTTYFRHQAVEYQPRDDNGDVALVA